VLAHARALLTSSSAGETAYIGADLRDSPAILAGAGETLDLGQPVALMFLMTLQYIPDADDPHAIVRRYLDALVPGSFLVVSDTANEVEDPVITAGAPARTSRTRRATGRSAAGWAGSRNGRAGAQGSGEVTGSGPVQVRSGRLTTIAS
jgi:hypothetical protein